MKRAAIWLAVGVLGLLTARANACDGCCDHCGCESNCCKVCRVVPDIKKVPKITYGCECEDFCIPGPSKFCGWKCECTKECECGHEKCHKSPVFQPGCCAKVKTRHKLVKKEEIKEVCSWKWKVETVCPTCKCRLTEAAKQLPADAVAQANANAAEQEDAEEVEAAEENDTEEATAKSEEANPNQLVSHSFTSKLKSKFAPLLGK